MRVSWLSAIVYASFHMCHLNASKSVLQPAKQIVVCWSPVTYRQRVPAGSEYCLREKVWRYACALHREAVQRILGRRNACHVVGPRRVSRKEGCFAPPCLYNHPSVCHIPSSHPFCMTTHSVCMPPILYAWPPNLCVTYLPATHSVWPPILYVCHPFCMHDHPFCVSHTFQPLLGQPFCVSHTIYHSHTTYHHVCHSVCHPLCVSHTFQPLLGQPACYKTAYH